MKKTLLVISCFVALISVDTFAQQAMTRKNGGDRPHPDNMQQHPMGDAVTRTQRFVDHLTKDLNLDAATAKKVYDAFLTRTKKVDEIQASNMDGKAKNDALKANKDNLDTALKGILSADQFQKYLEIEKSRRGRGHGEGGRPDRRPNR